MNALKVIQPANMCPCGVISVNDSASAYSTSTPVESFMPPGMPRSSEATSPGLIPASGAKKLLPFGQNSGKWAFHFADHFLRARG